jgi:hypothetical protein
MSAGEAVEFSRANTAVTVVRYAFGEVLQHCDLHGLFDVAIRKHRNVAASAPRAKRIEASLLVRN